jgi:peptide deformylase
MMHILDRTGVAFYQIARNSGAEVKSMSILSILEFPDPRLRTRAEPVRVFDAELKQFVAALFETYTSAYWSPT